MKKLPVIEPSFNLSDEETKVALKKFYRKRGYVRIANKKRKKQSASYKKGWEVRLITTNEAELTMIRGWIEHVGLKPGKPYLNKTRMIQPIYGKVALDWFRSRKK